MPESESKDETYYASITITDTSSFIRAPDLPQPSLRTMIHLEHEVSHNNEGVFLKGDDYILDADKREALLGVQEWRAGKFD